MRVAVRRAVCRVAGNRLPVAITTGLLFAAAVAFAVLPASIPGSSAFRGRNHVGSYPADGAVRASFSAPVLARVSVSVGAPLRSVPSSYLGIAVEYNDLLNYERTFASFTRLLAVLRPPGERGPVIMRVGGESADSSFWQNDDRTLVAPRYRQGHPYSLTPAWMAQLAALVRSARLKVILDLNLAAHSPKMAAQVARAARLALPAGSVKAFEIGNEPDLYRRGFVGLTRVKRGAATGLTASRFQGMSRCLAPTSARSSAPFRVLRSSARPLRAPIRDGSPGCSPRTRRANSHS